MKKRNKVISLIVTILTISYLVFDLIHFFMYRIDPVYPSFTEAFYESIYISFFKWGICISIIYGLFLDFKQNKLSFFILHSGAICIILLFIIKGQLFYLIRGSIVFILGILEIVALLTVVYSLFFLIKKYKIKVLYVIISILLTVFIMGCLIYHLPIYNAPY
jgi:hypothetical protein